MLLLLDGCDEYTEGTNKALDKAIESGIGNCFTILTSRPGTDSGDKTYVSQEIIIIIIFYFLLLYNNPFYCYFNHAFTCK